MFQSLCSGIAQQVVLRNNLSALSRRCISMSAVRLVKSVVEHRDGKTLTISADVKNSDRFHRLFDPGQKNGACPLCALGLDVRHTDVLILQQFIKPNGGLLPKRITGLCSWQQRKVGFMVAMAIHAGLMPDYGIAGAKLDTDWYFHFRRFNSYFDENTIRISMAEYRRKKLAKLEYAGKLALADELQ